MGLQCQFETAMLFMSLIPFIQIRVYNFERIETNINRDLMRIILFKSYDSLKWCIILSVLYVLMIFIIYKLYILFLINAILCHPNFAYVSSTIRDESILKHILIFDM